MCAIPLTVAAARAAPIPSAIERRLRAAVPTRGRAGSGVASFVRGVREPCEETWDDPEACNKQTYY